MSQPPIHDPATWTEEQAEALKAWSAGNASPGQQKAALAWVMYDACGVSRDCMVPGQPDMSAYFNGRRSVALQIAFVLGQRPSKKETK